MGGTRPTAGRPYQRQILAIERRAESGERRAESGGFTLCLNGKFMPSESPLTG